MTGETVGRYRLLKLLAQGGMGEVFLARQEGLKGFSKTVVVKRILDHLAEDKSFSEMFINEARLAALITHPNVVQVFDLGEEGGALYLAMEYVHGKSLRHVEQALLKRGRTMSPPLAARICQQALLGLSHAHRVKGDDGRPLNLVHRDISPDNILIGYDGSVKVTDFGIAKAATSQGLTKAGLVKGKVVYMPPEQLRAEALDARTDVYAMGTVLYELLTGRRPFTGMADTALMLAILNEPPPPLRSIVPSLDPALERIVFDALEKNPAYRPQGAAEMASALDAWAQTVRGEMVQTEIHSLLVELFGEESAELPTTPVGRIEALATPARTRPAEVGDETVRMTATQAHYATGAPAAAPQTATEPASAAAPGAARTPVWPLLIIALALMSGAGVFVWLRLNPAPQPPAQVVIVTAPPPPAPPPTPAPVPAPAPAPEPAPAVEAPVVVAKTGRMQIDVAPWGEVFFGKKSLGVTPMQPVTLPAGPQVLVVKNPDLKVEKKVKVNVPAGGNGRVLVNLLE